MGWVLIIVSLCILVWFAYNFVARALYALTNDMSVSKVHMFPLALMTAFGLALAGTVLLVL